MKKICEHCGKEFEVIPARAKDKRGRYCSIECRKASYKNTQTVVKCVVCGKDFVVNNWRFRSKYGERNPRYCSKECFKTKITKTCLYCGKKFEVKRYREETAECCSMACKNRYFSTTHKLDKHPQWKGGISFEPYCPLFNEEFKRRVRAFFNDTCVSCGTKITDYKICIHHVDYDKHVCCNGNPPIFVTLCRSCHTKTNNDREYWAMVYNEIVHIQYGGKCYYSRDEYMKIQEKV